MSRRLTDLTEILQSGCSLDSEAAAAAAGHLAEPGVEIGQKESFLTALSRKGESALEVAAFAKTFRAMAVDPMVDNWAEEAIDVCGTGGDNAHTFNISTAVSFIVAAAEVPVFKHGNRSITSKCGSADIIEALGIRLDTSAEIRRETLERFHFSFFFAPAFHPAFKAIMPVRKALAAKGQRTIFNLLGPLINPGRPAYQLMGVFAESWVEPIAGALGELGLRGGLVAHCTPGAGLNLDELSCAGRNRVAGCGRMQAIGGELSPQEGGLEACGLEDLRGGGVDENLKTMEALLAGAWQEIPNGLVDSVLLNAGAALWVAGRASDLKSGVASAREVVESGHASAWLANVRDFFKAAGSG